MSYGESECELCHAVTVYVRALIGIKAPSRGGRHERDWWVCDECVDAFRTMLRSRRREKGDDGEVPYDWTLTIAGLP